MTELQSFGATERVAEYSDPLQIEASRNLPAGSDAFSLSS